MVCLPSDDPEFERAARRVVRSRPELMTEEAETLLHAEYPKARLLLRVGKVGVVPTEQRETWYAYRDGSLHREA